MQAITNTMSTWGTQVASDVESILTALLPIALGVLGLSIAVMFGINFFRKVVGEGGYSGEMGDFEAMNEWQEMADVTGFYDESDVYHEIVDEDSYQAYREWEASLE